MRLWQDNETSNQILERVNHLLEDRKLTNDMKPNCNGGTNNQYTRPNNEALQRWLKPDP